MADLTAVTMPKWGLAMEEGTVTSWLIPEGGVVAAGAELVEVETSKIANVVEAPAGGTLLRRTAADGEVLPVGALLAVIGPADAAAHDVDAFVAQRQAQAEAEVAVRDTGPAAPQTVEIDGRAISYIEAGPHGGAGQGDATPVLLIHGFCGDRNNWLFNLDALANRRRVIAMDLPGHGASVKEVGGAGLDILAGAASGLLRALGIEKAVVVGHSMGGAAALTLALDHPSQVAGVVALGSFGLGAPVERDFLDAILAADRRKEMKAALEFLFADPALVSRDMVEALLAFKRIDGVQPALDSLALGALAPASGEALAARLGDLKVPVLALHGSEDRVIRPPSGAPLPVETLPGIGHMLQMEAAGAVNARIVALVEGL